MDVTSQSLLQRLNDRANAQAWQRLHSVYEPWLRGWLGRQDLQSADVEDLLQDVLVVVSQELPRFVHNGQPGAFRSWLRTILSNRVRHFLRTRKNREGLVAPQPLSDWVEQLADPASALSKQWDQEHDHQLVRRLLASIQPEFNETTWHVFQMLVLEDRPPRRSPRPLESRRTPSMSPSRACCARMRAELHGLIDL